MTPVEANEDEFSSNGWCQEGVDTSKRNEDEFSSNGCYEENVDTSKRAWPPVEQQINHVGREDDKIPMIARTSSDFARITRNGGFRPGDHVYICCDTYKHHAIIVGVNSDDDTMTVADFTAFVSDEQEEQGVDRNISSSFSSSSSASSSSSSINKTGGFRFLTREDPSNYKKVNYEVNRLQCGLSPPGTCTPDTPDDPRTILARVEFLGENYHLLPPYHIVLSNCETVAFWCMTGKWRTHQVMSVVQTTGAVGTAGLGGAAGYVSTATVAAPAAGVWGWLGFTTEVALATSQPFLLPVIVAGGSVVLGSSLWSASRIRHKWKKTTEKLNGEFLESEVYRRLLYYFV